MEKFDLLELVWWQNPYYLLAIACGALILIMISVWYGLRWMKKIVKMRPYKKLLQRLHRLQISKLETYDTQRVVCHELSQITKDWIILSHGIGQLSMTDQEFIHALESSDISEQKKMMITTLCTQLSPVKFAGAACDRQFMLNHINYVAQCIRTDMIQKS